MWVEDSQKDGDGVKVKVKLKPRPKESDKTTGEAERSSKASRVSDKISLKKRIMNIFNVLFKAIVMCTELLIVPVLWEIRHSIHISHHLNFRSSPIRIKRSRMPVKGD